MASLRWKSTERRIGVVGPSWSGKTVLLTSLVSHLQFHDPSRFCIGRIRPADDPLRGRSIPFAGLIRRPFNEVVRAVESVTRNQVDRSAEILRFRSLDDAESARRGGGLGWFDADAHRNRLVQGGVWPAKTRDASQFLCEFERTDWNFNKGRLRLFDLPGERVNDISMLRAGDGTSTGYAEWSDRFVRRIQADLTALPIFEPFLKLLEAAEPANESALIAAFKRCLAGQRSAYKPYISPSTFVLDREGVRFSGRPTDDMVQKRYVGLSPGDEFVPLSAGYRLRCPETAERFAERFGRYTREVVTPIVSLLRSCDGLVVMVDVLAILGHGEGMYNDCHDLSADLVATLDPSDSLLRRLARGLGFQHRLSRLAFVAPKIDRVLMADYDRVKSLLNQLVRHSVKGLRGVETGYFTVSAMRGSREVGGALSGSLMYDPSGQPLQPGSERSYPAPRVPDEWPKQGWVPGQFVYPDVYPRVSRLTNCPFDQTGLDSVFNFLVW